MNKDRIEAFQKEAVEMYHYFYERIKIVYDARGWCPSYPSHVAINEDKEISLINMSEESHDRLDSEDMLSSEADFLAKYAAIKAKRLKDHEQRYAERAEREKAEDLKKLRELQEKYKNELDL